MNLTRILILVGALGAAGVAAFLARGLVGGQNNASASPNMEMTEILVAAKSIEVGSKVMPGDLKWQGWPKAAVDPSFVAKHQAPGAMDELAAEGSVARLPLANGEPVTTQKVIKADGAGFMAAVLTPGKRAIGVKLTTDRSAGGFILPNDRVDVIMTRKLGSAGGVPIYRAATVLQDVRVLAVDQTAQEDGESKTIVGKTATLELSAAQAEVLALAEAMGDLSLSLRSLQQSDGKSKEDEEFSAKALGGGDEDNVVVLRFGIPSQMATNAKE